MKKTWKALMSFALIAAMVFGLSACGEQTQYQQQDQQRGDSFRHDHPPFRTIGPKGPEKRNALFPGKRAKNGLTV